MDEPSEAKPKLLIVDDEENTVRMLRQTFKKKYDVSTAASTEEAIEKFSLDAFDVAIVDYSMGNLDGTVLISRLREHMSDDRIFLLSAENWLGDPMVASGDYIFVSKKSDTKELEHYVEVAVRKLHGR